MKFLMEYELKQYRRQWLVVPKLVLAMLVTLVLGARIVIADELDRQALVEKISLACPTVWEELDSEFLDGKSTISDPWQGNDSDRTLFQLYLQQELAEDFLSAQEISSLTADPMTVITECTFQKLQLLRLQAHQAANVELPEPLLTAQLSESSNLPDGSSPQSAAFSCDLLKLSYPDLVTGSYWIDVDGGDESNAVQQLCNFDQAKDGSVQVLAAASCEIIQQVNPEAESGYFWIDEDGGSAVNAIQQYCEITNMATGATQLLAASSCQEVKTNIFDSSNGLFWIDVNGGDTSDAFQVYCDMQSEGGGWTMVLAQFESDKLVNWNEGRQSDYDPTLATTKSFTLASADLPAHSEVAFGKGNQATYVDYVDFVYVTSDIPRQTLSGKKSGKTYQIHRNASGGYQYCDPESRYRTSTAWRNSLQIDETGGRNYTWCYRPNSTGFFWLSAADLRGFSMLGTAYNQDDFAWTLWVR